MPGSRYHDFGRLVKRAGGDVVLIIKDNTPATRADLELFFEDPQADRGTWQSFAQIEKGQRRLERRQITTSPDLNDASRGATGAKWARSFGCNANAKAKTSAVSRWSLAGPASRQSSVVHSVWPSSFALIGWWKIGSTGVAM